MIQYTDIMINKNTKNNKEDNIMNTMKIKHDEYHSLSTEDQKKHVDFKNKTLWVLYFLKDPLNPGVFKIGRAISQYNYVKRIAALRGKRYSYGKQLEVVTTKWATEAEVCRLENLLKAKYKKNQEEQKHTVMRLINGKYIPTTTDALMNGGKEWFRLNDEEIKDVLSHYEYNEVETKEAA